MEKRIKKILNKKKYKWIVTGCSGFIGSNLVKKLLAYNQIVYGIDIRKSNIKNKNYRFIRADLSKKIYFNKIKTNIDYVIHQASKTSVLESYKCPEVYLNQNFISLKNLIDFSKKKKIRTLIFASSSAIYGNRKKKL